MLTRLYLNSNGIGGMSVCTYVGRTAFKVMVGWQYDHTLEKRVVYKFSKFRFTVSAGVCLLVDEMNMLVRRVEIPGTLESVGSLTRLTHLYLNSNRIGGMSHVEVLI